MSLSDRRTCSPSAVTPRQRFVGKGSFVNEVSAITLHLSVPQQGAEFNSEEDYEATVRQNEGIAQQKQLIQVERQVKVGSEIKHDVRKDHDDNDQSESSAGFALFVD